MIRILIGGDVCPMGKVQASFAAGDADDIFHDLLTEIRSADLAIANLECPLISRPSPITKSGPALGAPLECVRALVEAQWDVLNLANNHSYDHGAVGLLETLDTIGKAGLAVVGAGANLEAAQAPLVREINGQRIVIYSMAEREFSVAGKTTPGANPLDLISFVYAVRQHKQGGIFIAIVHGGREYYDYPSPEMVRRCRFMVEMGADAVICCHTHCPLPWEIHAERPIVYGLGNLVFEPLGAEALSWHQGYLARIEIHENAVRFEPIPYTQSLTSIGVASMSIVDTEAFRRELLERGNKLKDVSFLETNWREYCQLQKVNYLSMLLAYSPIMQRLRRVILPILHSRRDILTSLLLVQCETHREILETLFEEERSRG